MKKRFILLVAVLSCKSANSQFFALTVDNEKPVIITNSFIKTGFSDSLNVEQKVGKYIANAGSSIIYAIGYDNSFITVSTNSLGIRNEADINFEKVWNLLSDSQQFKVNLTSNLCSDFMCNAKYCVTTGISNDGLTIYSDDFKVPSWRYNFNNPCYGPISSDYFGDDYLLVLRKELIADDVNGFGTYLHIFDLTDKKLVERIKLDNVIDIKVIGSSIFFIWRSGEQNYSCYEALVNLNGKNYEYKLRNIVNFNNKIYRIY